MRIVSIVRAGLIGALALAGTANCLTFQNDDAAANAAGCAACSGVAGFAIFFLVAVIALNIAILVWVARDAKARGLDNAVLWMLLVFFLGLIGLVIYLFARPQGNLVQCPNCGNKKLQAS